MGAALTTRGRLRLLEAAFDHGITHFDTAPLYGQGLAESLIGAFARHRRDRLTITTKFGLLPRQRPAVVRPLLPIARVLNRRLLIPLRQRSSSQTRKAEAPAPSPAPSPASLSSKPTKSLACPPVPHAPAMLRSHLERSLHELKTDYIDYYLLHECHADYLNEAFLHCLEDLVKEGKIRHYGIGSGRLQTRRILENHPTIPWVAQIPDGWADLDTEWFCQHSRLPLFTHSSLRLSKESGAKPPQAFSELWAKLTGQDPSHPGLLSELLLTVALAKNHSGCVIFSSSSIDHIRNNTQLLEQAPHRRHAVQEILSKAMGSVTAIHP